MNHASSNKKSSTSAIALQRSSKSTSSTCTGRKVEAKRAPASCSLQVGAGGNNEDGAGMFTYADNDPSASQAEFPDTLPFALLHDKDLVKRLNKGFSDAGGLSKFMKKLEHVGFIDRRASGNNFLDSEDEMDVWDDDGAEASSDHAEDEEAFAGGNNKKNLPGKTFLDVDKNMADGDAPGDNEEDDQEQEMFAHLQGGGGDIGIDGGAGGDQMFFGEDDEDVADEQPDEFPLPDGFVLQPGEEGFNAALKPKLKEAIAQYEKDYKKKYASELSSDPKKAVSKLLAHQARTKIVILPKRHHCDNLFKELFRWPSRWRDYFAASHSDLVPNKWQDKKKQEWIVPKKAEVFAKFRDCVGMKGKIGYGRIKKDYVANFTAKEGFAPPSAPLRIFNYVTAGGAALGYARDGSKKNFLDPCLKFRLHKENPYAGKLLIMDEAHNLVRTTEHRFGPSLDRLRNAVERTAAHGTAKNPGTWVYLMTATPVQPGVPPRRLLQLVKGRSLVDQAAMNGDALTLPPQDVRNDEGFVSSFHKVIAEYPTLKIAGVCSNEVIGSGLQLAGELSVDLRGRGLARYIEAAHNIEEKYSYYDQKQRAQYLSRFSTCPIVPQQVQKQWSDLKHYYAEYFPKLEKVIAKLLLHNRKTLVIISRKTGYLAALQLLLEKVGKSKVATFAQIGAFNCDRTNLYGAKKLVMLATAEECGEGIEFRSVRDFHILDVPSSASEYAQMVGRPVRVNSHAKLQPSERNVSIYVHSATIDSMYTTASRKTQMRRVTLSKNRTYRDRVDAGLTMWAMNDEPPLKNMKIVQGATVPSETIDEEKLRRLKEDLNARTSTLDKIRAKAVDKGLW
eukprot:g14452.t1